MNRLIDESSKQNTHQNSRFLPNRNNTQTQSLSATIEICSRGFNALSGEYSDLVKDGVIDPTDVVLTALRNAVSIAGLNLTTDALITDVDDHDEPVVNAVV